MHELSADGFSNLCRLCGEEEECFDLFAEDGEGAEILDRIRLSIGIAIKEGDGLPSGICNGCHEKLEACSAFYDQCHDTQERLREFISIESVLHKSGQQDSEDNDTFEGNEDNSDYIYVEVEGDQNASAYVKAEEDTAAATESTFEFMEIEQGQDLSDAPTFAVSAEEVVASDGRNHPVTMMSAPMPIIIEHVDSMIPANIGVTKKNLTDDQPLSAEKPKKKLIYVVKNASNIPVQSVLSAVFGESQPQTAHTAQSAVPSKPGVIKLKRHHDDEISQQVVIKGSDGKENMIFLDMSTPVSVVSTEAPEESEDVDDPTWNPSISDKPVSRGAALSQLKRARSAVKNSVRTLRLPKPLKPRAVKERIETTLPRRQTQITEDDPNYAVMMEKFSKPVSISTLKRHGLYKSRPNGYKINAPYKKDVAPYIDKISETEYQCKICLTAKFRWNYKAEIHILEHLDWRPFECDVCGRAFTQNQYLTKHKRLHFPDDTNFMCEVCGKGFQRRYYLTYHMDEHFDRTYTCAECGRKFSRRQKHDEHVRYHHKCHYSVCDVCGQTMRTTALSRHRKQHGEKHMRKKRESSLQTPGSCQGTWLTCNVCGRAFRSVRERDEHEAEHGNSLLPFQCEECVVYFKSKRTLNNHIFHAHGCVTDEESQIVGEVVTQEEECEVATRVLDELSSTIVVNIPGDL